MIKLKDLILETDTERELQQLRKDIEFFNAAADKKYREIAGGGTEHFQSQNPFQPYMFNQHSPEEGHRLALQHPEYRLLKALAQTYENDLRKLEKRLKKIKK
jgi:hypothetical protein